MMYKHEQQLALVLVQPLHLNVKQRIRRDRDPGLARDELGQRLLVVPLGARRTLLKAGVVRQGLQLPKLIEIGDPAARRWYR